MLTQVAGVMERSTRDREIDALCPDDITERQRARIRRAVEKRIVVMQHRLAMVASGADGVDPEAALVSVRALQRACTALLADAARILA